MSCLEFAGKTCTDLDLLFDFPCLQAIGICKIWGMFWCFMVASQTGLGQTKDCRHKHAIAAICCRWTMVTMGYVGHGPCDLNIKVRPEMPKDQKVPFHERDPSSWLLKTIDDCSSYMRLPILSQPQLFCGLPSRRLLCEVPLVPKSISPCNRWARLAWPTKL